MIFILQNAIRGFRRCVRFGLLRLARRCPVFADLYYLLTGTFRTEHLKTIEAILAARHRTTSFELHQLRQRIHGLDKGLTIQPRRPVFAKKWIGITVELFEQLFGPHNTAGHSSCGLREWATAVLKAYFTAVAPGQDAVVDAARARFARLMDRAGSAANADPLVLRSAADRPVPISYDQLHALASNRGSVRQFDGRPVPREAIRKAMDVARMSPSACNRQGFQFLAVDDPDRIREIGQLDSDGAGMYEGFPCLVVLLGKVDAYPSDRERHLIYIDASLAAMSFQFALQTLGLGSCCLMWPEDGKSEARLRRMLGFGPLDRPVLFMAVGWPDAKAVLASSRKKDVSELLLFVGLEKADTPAGAAELQPSARS